MRVDLADRALDLARMLRLLLPEEREVGGLLALLLVHQARAASRVDAAAVWCVWRTRTARSGTRR